MLFIIILNYGSDVKQDINCLVLNLLIFVIEQLIKHSEYLVGSFVLLSLCALLLHKLDKWDELVQ